GRKSKVRSRRASGPFCRAGSMSAKPTSTASRSRPAATRRCGRNRSVAAWRWKGYMSPSTRRGIRLFRAELLSFPAGKHDDQVDAVGLIGQLLDKMTAWRPPKRDPEVKRDDYCEFQEQFSDDVLTL